MKNVLYVTVLPKEYGGQANGGIATHSSQLIEEAKKNYKVGIYSNIIEGKKLEDVVLHNRKSNKISKFLKGLYSFLRLSKKQVDKLNFLNLKEKIKVLHHYFNFKKIIKNYDIIHVHSLYNNCITALSLIEDRPKLIVTDHGFWQGEIEKEIHKVRYNSKVADEVIYISNFAKKKMKEYKLDMSNLNKIYNPYLNKNIDLQKKEIIKTEFGFKKFDKIIFFSGISEPIKRKGLDSLLEAVSKDNMLKNEVTTIIITNNKGIEYAKKYKNKIKNLILLKPVSFEEVMKYYLISDVFVLPSKSESFGLVYIESLACGTPVIGFEQVIEEFKTLYKSIYIGESYNFKKDNHNDLSDNIHKILSCNTDRFVLRAKTLELFSWNNCFEKFQEVYNK